MVRHQDVTRAIAGGPDDRLARNWGCAARRIVRTLTGEDERRAGTMGTRGCRRRRHAGHSTGLALVAAVVVGGGRAGVDGLARRRGEATVIGSFTVDQAFATAVNEARDRVYVTRIGTPAIYAYDSNTFALVGVRTIANFPVTVEVNDVTGNVMVAHQGDGNKGDGAEQRPEHPGRSRAAEPVGSGGELRHQPLLRRQHLWRRRVGGRRGVERAASTTINLDGDSTLGIANPMRAATGSTPPTATATSWT